MDWVLITKWGKEPIGAVGLLGDEVVIVAAFFDDKDGNKDGKVSWGEWAAFKMSPFSLKGMNVVEVAMQARVEPDVILRDSEFPRMAAQMFTKFAAGLITDGIYAAYIARGVGSLGGAVASSITSSMVKSYVIKKGFEKAVKEAFMAGVGR